MIRQCPAADDFLKYVTRQGEGRSKKCEAPFSDKEEMMQIGKTKKVF